MGVNPEVEAESTRAPMAASGARVTMQGDREEGRPRDGDPGEDPGEGAGAVGDHGGGDRQARPSPRPGSPEDPRGAAALPVPQRAGVRRGRGLLRQERPGEPGTGVGGRLVPRPLAHGAAVRARRDGVVVRVRSPLGEDVRGRAHASLADPVPVRPPAHRPAPAVPRSVGDARRRPLGGRVPVRLLGHEGRDRRLHGRVHVRAPVVHLLPVPVLAHRASAVRPAAPEHRAHGQGPARVPLRQGRRRAHGGPRIRDRHGRGRLRRRLPRAR